MPYADYEDIEKSNDKLDGEHIVYVGRVYTGKNVKGTFSLHHIFEDIARNKIHIHVYPTNYKELKNNK